MKLNQVLSFGSNSCRKLAEFQIHQFSSLTKRPKNSSRSAQTREGVSRKAADVTVFGSLFSEITEILGGENVNSDRVSSGILTLEKARLGKFQNVDEQLPCAQGVCGIADRSVSQEQENAQVGNLDEDGVSRIVHRVAEVVRAKNDPAPLEERLENLDVRFDSEIVEKVLKRCFKVPHLAIRFFNWVKLRDGFSHTTKIFNVMITIAGEMKDIELVEKLVKEMENSSCDKDIKTWTILISLYGNAKQISRVLLISNEMKKSGCEPDALSYTTIIRALCNSGNPEIAIEFYREMVKKEIQPETRTYKLLLDCLAKSGDTASVLAVANDMITVSQIPENTVYYSVLKSFCISTRIKEALEYVRDLNKKGIVLGPEYFEILVSGLCRADRIPDALEIVEIMKARNFVDGKVYGIIINWYLKRNDISKALALFQNMKESGFLPITSTYTQLMQHLFMSNEYQKGFELYQEMQDKGIELDHVAIMAVVAGYVRQNRIMEAWKLFKSMEKPTWKSFSVFIKELSRVSQTRDVVNLLEEMLDSDIAIGDDLFRWILSYLEKKCDMPSLEKVEKMRSIYTPLPQEDKVYRDDKSEVQDLDMVVKSSSYEPSNVDSNLLDQVMETYREEDLQEFCRILSSSIDWHLIEEELEKCSVQFTPHLVLEILRSCHLHGHAALHFFKWVGRRAGYAHTTETYNMAMKLAGHGKDFKHMRSLFYEMRRNHYSITSDTWTIMIMQYGRTGLTNIALKIFREMKASGAKPTASTYKYLIISLCGKKGRKADEAIKIFQEMTCAGHIPDKELIESYLDCLCQVGKLSDAKKCREVLCKVGFTTSLSFSLYIRALCRAGKLDEALAMVNKVGAERSIVDQYISGSLVHGLLQKGQVEEALRRVDSMKQSGIAPTVHAYTSLMAYFFKEKQIGRALEVYANMLREGCEPTVVTFSALIQGYTSTGEFANAWNVFNYMKKHGPSPDFRTYSMFIGGLCKCGKSEEALQLLSEMLRSGIAPSTVNFREVFFGLNRERKHALARTVLQQKFSLRRRRKFLT